jgi:hypothetical protein
LELGQYPTGTDITYWICAFDTANNIADSDQKSLTVV